jgi:hypothetical protein
MRQRQRNTVTKGSKAMIAEYIIEAKDVAGNWYICGRDITLAWAKIDAMKRAELFPEISFRVKELPSKTIVATYN